MPTRFPKPFLSFISQAYAPDPLAAPFVPPENGGHKLRNRYWNCKWDVCSPTCEVISYMPLVLPAIMWEGASCGHFQSPMQGHFGFRSNRAGTRFQIICLLFSILETSEGANAVCQGQ